MRQSSLILLPTLILLCIVISTNAERLAEKNGTDIPCFFDGAIVLGTGTQKDCLAKEIPGFAGYTVNKCIMTVYLKSLDQIDKAKAILDPFFRESVVGKHFCKSRTRVVIREVRYSWTELIEWKKLAFNPEIRGLESFFSINIDEGKNAVYLFFEGEADVQRAREILARLGIPKDAYVLRSQADLDRPRMVQIRDGELVIPAFVSGYERVGDLVLGKTTLAQAQRMFPVSPPGYEGRPRKPDGYPKSKFGEVSPKPKLVFNPWESMYALFFDKNERLVIVMELGSLFEGKTVAEIGELYPGLRKTESIKGYYEMQTELAPCAALMLMVTEGSDIITQAAYVYTCKTER